MFFFNDTATTEIYTLSLHDALPISGLPRGWSVPRVRRDYTQRRWAVPAYVGSRYLRARLPAGARAMLGAGRCELVVAHWMIDRKSTRLNSSHANISYAVFCLKKKK